MNTAARTLNFLIGLWLVCAAFIWREPGAQFYNVLLSGCVCALVATVAMKYPAVRLLNTVVGVWLLLSVFLLPVEHAATRWDNVVAGLVVFCVALLPSPLPRPRRDRDTAPLVPAERPA